MIASAEVSHIKVTRHNSSHVIRIYASPASALCQDIRMSIKISTTLHDVKQRLVDANQPNAESQKPPLIAITLVASKRYLQPSKVQETAAGSMVFALTNHLGMLNKQGKPEIIRRGLEMNHAPA